MIGKFLKFLCTLTCCAIIVAGATSAQGAATVDAEITWLEGKPHGLLTVHDGPAEATATLTAAWSLFDAKGTRLAQGEAKLTAGADRTWSVDVPLDKIQDLKKTHRWDVTLRDAALDLDFGARITASGEQASVPWYGIAHQGIWPRRTVSFLVSLPGFKSAKPREIPVEVVVRDGDDAVVLQRPVQLPPSETRQVRRIDVTPDTSTSVGPYQVEINIDSEVHSLSFRATERFAQPCAEIPLSSFEHGDRTMWFAAEGQPQQYVTLAYYYSQHLTDLLLRDYPKIAYDPQQKHSGRQGLQIGYELGREAYVWSRQELPGKPSALSLWVHGNESPDELLIRFEDHINFAQPGYARNPNFEQAKICTLDFAGWRRFQVPVLGDGLQVSGIKGSTVEIDAPVKIMALVVKSLKPKPPAPKPVDPAKPAQPAAAPAEPAPVQWRTIWVDDMAVQTQVAETARLSLELQASNPDGQLTADSRLFASVGNGRGADLPRGKLNLTARDPEGQAIWTQAVELPAKVDQFTAADVPLKELAARAVSGPIDIDVTFTDPSVAGTRITRRLTWKRPQQAGLVFDFEQPETYSGYQPGLVTAAHAQIVDGGAEGSAHALAIKVDPLQADNSVLLHPALPGILDRVELLVRGGDRPVVLQPWFIDSGRTGLSARNVNLFWAEPITVDWKDWRKITIATPPIPAGYADKNRTFLFEPCYPLNLAFNAKTDGETPVEIRLDQLRAITHLPREDWQRIELEYPDETRIHAPGAPLTAIVTNFSHEPATAELAFTLKQAQGHVVQQKKLPLKLPAGSRQRVTLVEHLEEGVYDLQWSGFGRESQPSPILVLGASRYFGPSPLTYLVDPLQLRRSLGLTTERIYLDWDNVEPAPYLRHWFWFDSDAKKKRDVPLLPEQLQPLAVGQLAAAKAVTEREQALLTLHRNLNPALQVEKQAAQKQAASLLAIDAPKQAVEAARKAATDTTTKADQAAAAFMQAQLAHAEATKNATQLAQQLKQATDQNAAVIKQAAATDKLRQDADKSLAAARPPLAEADKQATAAQTALAAAQTEQTAAQAARDAAQTALTELAKSAEATDEQKKAAEKKLAEATAKLTESQKKVEAAGKTATAAQQRRTTAQQALDAAQAKLTESQVAATTAQQAALQAKTALESATSQATAGQQALAAAKKTLDEKQKLAQQTKAEQGKAQGALQQAEAKLAGVERTWAADQQTFASKAQARRDIQTGLQQMVADLLRERAVSAAANEALDKAKAPLSLKLDPVVGFSADWAGPEAREPLARGSYVRWIPNILQVPERLIDWSLFVREIQREYGPKFDRWVFWENPDLEQAPQSIPPERYRSLLESFHRWVKLYNPRAKVVAGGFNFDKSLEYLARIPEPHTLPLDEIAVQMNLGELSPEQADMEGYLDDLNSLIKLRETGRSVSITELDWGIGPYVSPIQQAAYHARASLILNSRGAAPHQFQLVNTGFDLSNYGVFYRLPYGNSADLQTFKKWYVPKPAYIALIEMQRFLAAWKFVSAVPLSGRSQDDQRAFVYRNAEGRLAVAMWRTVDGPRVYRLPADWKGAQVHDVFDVPAQTSDGLRLTGLPLIVYLPQGHTLEALLDQLRRLEAADGSYPVALDLQLSESDNRTRAHYQSTGKTNTTEYGGQLPGGRKLRESFVEGLEQEQFTFNLPQAGQALLLRRWYFDGQGQTLSVSINGGTQQPWNLGPGQDNAKGVRESTFVLRDCVAGENRVSIHYAKPGNASGYRVEPFAGNVVPLARWGAINTRQSRGRFIDHANVAGGPLSIGKTTYEDGVGAHATSFIEYPLNRQFDKFEVTVGIDGSTEGRGSVVFRVFVDGQTKADSGVLNGFNPAKTLVIDKLGKADRLILSVTDAGDGDKHDLANWVDGKLTLKAVTEK